MMAFKLAKQKMQPQLLQNSREHINMRHYIVQIAKKALLDMEEIYDYIVEIFQVPEAAMWQYDL